METIAIDWIIGLDVVDSCGLRVSLSMPMYSHGLMFAYTRIGMLLTSLRQCDDVRTRITGLSEESPHPCCHSIYSSGDWRMQRCGRCYTIT